MFTANKLTIGKLKSLLSMIDSKWDDSIINLVSDYNTSPITVFDISINQDIFPIFYHGQQLTRGKTQVCLKITTEDT